MNKELSDKLLVRDKWARGLLMLMYVFIKYGVSWLIVFIALFQFVSTLVTDKPNAKLLDVSKNLNLYLLQLVNFLTYNSEIKPFPFSDWPKGDSQNFS